MAHIFASFNDTFIHVTDLSGRFVACFRSAASLTAPCSETIVRITGGMKVKADRDEVRCVWIFRRNSNRGAVVPLRGDACRPGRR